MTVLFLSFPPGFIFSNMLTKRPPSAQRKSKRPRRNFQVTVSTVWEFGTNSEAVEEVAVPSFFSRRPRRFTEPTGTGEREVRKSAQSDQPTVLQKHPRWFKARVAEANVRKFSHFHPLK